MSGNRDRTDRSKRTYNDPPTAREAPRHAQVPAPNALGFIQPHGGYRELLAYRKAEIVYDATVCFCRRFLDKRDRTWDQMVQAARSGKQNIIEGSQAAATSTEMEIKLTGVARASLEELLADYQDYLRTRNLQIWDKDSRAALAIRQIGRSHDESYEQYRDYLEQRSDGTVANIVVCLIHQANYLLDRQLARLEKDFIEHGGLRERMTQARLERRAQQRRQPPELREPREAYRTGKALSRLPHQSASTDEAEDLAILLDSLSGNPAFKESPPAAANLSPQSHESY